MKKGFTLLELIIVITILAVLAGAMIPLFSTTRRQAQDAKAMADLDAIKSASVMYHYDTRSWPQAGSSGFLTCLVSNTGGGCPTTAGGWSGPYLTDWTNDPYSGTTRTYAILNAASDRQFAQSAGPDGAYTAGCTGDDVCVLMTSNRLQ